MKKAKTTKAPAKPAKKSAPIEELLRVMAALRAPDGCPWDREQDHRSIRMHAVEEVYEMVDAIEAGDDHELGEELGDLLLQVVFHCQLGSERGVFDFDEVCRRIVEKLIRRHPHVFGDSKAKTVDAVWAQWEQIKKAEKVGTKHERPSALDGIPRHLPALMRTEKLTKKARKAGLLATPKDKGTKITKAQLGQAFFALAAEAQAKGWSAEALLRAENARQEKAFRRVERQQKP